MKGLIFNIKRYSIHDGPGIRVTFFLKGCSLSCRWCHNPEGISPEPGEILQVNRVGEKEFSRKAQVGKYYEVTDVIRIIEQDRVFIEESGGGVTFSGGEPLNQADFLCEALEACRMNGYHTAVDTSGYFQPDSLGKILPFTDLFLFDIKHLDPDKHMEYTGGGNSVIIGNLHRILESGKDVILRIPVIPGINDDPVHLGEMKRFIEGIKNDHLKIINLLPFHKTGSSKYRKFNMEYRLNGLKQPSAERMKELKEYFSAAGVPVRIGG